MEGMGTHLAASYPYSAGIGVELLPILSYRYPTTYDSEIGFGATLSVFLTEFYNCRSGAEATSPLFPKEVSAVR